MTAEALPTGQPRPVLSAQLAALVRPWRGSLLVIGLLVLAASLLELVPPLLMRWIVDDHLAVGDAQGLLLLAFLYLAATALGQGLSFVYGYLAAAVAQQVLSSLRVRLFGHLQRLPTTYFDRTPMGDSISRCTADIETLDLVFTSGVATLVANVFRLVTIAGAMVLLSPSLSILAALIVPPLILITRFFQVRIRSAERANRRAVGVMNTSLEETLTGVEVVQAFGREASLIARFRSVLRGVLQAYNRSALYSSFYPPVTALMSAAAIAFLVWAGTREAFGTLSISIGTLTAFALLTQRFFTPITALGDEWQTVQSALSGAERIFELLSLPVDEEGPATATGGAAPAGIEVDGVVFGYREDEPVLHGVDLLVAPGEHVALVGRTGAGKTSIVHLLAGLYEPWQGTVRVAGQVPRSMPDQERRRVLGIVPQTSQLFTGSVLDNLTLNEEAISEAEAVAAARISGADAFIRALPDGYQTRLRGSGGGKGVRLSAGQEQLLSLARALVRRPAVLLFDEATSAVDGASEAALREALREEVMPSGTAVLTVAHRLATAREADRVIVIDHGRIIEEGPPAELVSRGGRFAALLELEAAGWDWKAPT
ncbi:MAG: ABC transporter ATP-binding protein/permease [Dehalococcoidia bacterium]|nr:ABC transporter ATP-binding protein/permease [Dehalococcoidia bacterium]